MDTLELLDIIDALNESLSNLEGIDPSDTLGLMDAIDGVNENLVKLGGTAGESELGLTLEAEQAYEIQPTPSDDTGSHLKSIIRGKPSKVKTAKGTELDTIFALVDAKYLIASHTASGAENPKYPQDLQPRDRKRESSIAWVQKTSKDLDPDMLGKTRRADSGAPIVGDDLVVESGNGRTMAILLAYKNGDADEYKAWLVENSDIFGFTSSQVEKYVEPVLVRIRLTPIDRSAFAVEANQDDKLSFTATERAKSDSKRITDAMLELFEPSDDGDLLAASNRSFIRQFLASLGSTEAAQYTDKDGNPTQALVVRIKAAIFSKAYDDERLLEMMADQTKPDLQNMLNALSMAAPQFVAAQAISRSNAFDVAEKIVDGIEKSLNDQVKMAIIDATNMISAAKRNNQSIAEYVTQQGLFEQVDDATASLAIFLATHSRSSKKMAHYFKAMANFIKQDSESRQTLDMFGEPEPISLADVMVYANSVVDPDAPQTPEDKNSQSAYSPDNPYAQYANDDADAKKNADDWEARKPLTEDMLADFNQLAESQGYTTYAESRHAGLGVFQAEKEVGNLKVAISGQFKNHGGSSAYEDARDFTMSFDVNGETEEYQYSNDLSLLLSKANEWLGSEPQNPKKGSDLSQILSDLQAGRLSPTDLDLAKIDSLISDKSEATESILGQIMDIVADNYADTNNKAVT